METRLFISSVAFLVIFSISSWSSGSLRAATFRSNFDDFSERRTIAINAFLDLDRLELPRANDAQLEYFCEVIIAAYEGVRPYLHQSEVKKAIEERPLAVKNGHEIFLATWKLLNSKVFSKRPVSDSTFSPLPSPEQTLRSALFQEYILTFVALPKKHTAPLIKSSKLPFVNLLLKYTLQTSSKLSPLEESVLELLQQFPKNVVKGALRQEKTHLLQRFHHLPIINVGEAGETKEVGDQSTSCYALLAAQSQADQVKSFKRLADYLGFNVDVESF